MVTINSKDIDFTLSGKGDHYASHLAHVTVEKNNQIITTEDIYNEYGVLLLKKGAVLNNKAAKKIVNHKLNNPIEEDIAIERSLSGKVLAEKFIELQQKYPDIKRINEANHYEDEIKDLFIKKRLHPVLIQKLTILNEELPKYFEKGLFSAWLSSLTARKMKFDQYGIYNAFLAGLTHELGFVHLDPEIVNSNKELTPEEWRTIQSHVVVGKIVLENISEVSEEVSRAVLEHHENCDGSGYPASKTKKDLSIIGNIISMVDSIYAKRVNQFEKSKQTLAEIFPYLQLNYSTHSLEVYETIYDIVKCADLKRNTRNPHGTVEKYAAYVLKKSQAISPVIPELMTLLDNLLNIKQYSSNKHALTIISVTTRMVTMLNMSGLLFDEHLEWLKTISAKADDDITDELNQNDLMLGELEWQLRNTQRFLSLFSDDLTDAKEKEKLSLEGSINKLQNCLIELKKL